MEEEKTTGRTLIDMTAKTVKLYGLSTCAYCQAIRKMLNDLGVVHDHVDADLLADAERDALVAELQAINPQCSFPTTVVGDQVILGFKVQEIKEAVGIRTEVDELYDRLKKTQEAKGYFFNHDRERTFDLLRGLLINRDRYGYMSCPCRLASGNRQQDADIICPCVYRQADVAEFGACYCQLYVSEAWNQGAIPRLPVPERRTIRQG